MCVTIKEEGMNLRGSEEGREHFGGGGDMEMMTACEGTCVCVGLQGPEVKYGGSFLRFLIPDH